MLPQAAPRIVPESIKNRPSELANFPLNETSVLMLKEASPTEVTLSGIVMLVNAVAQNTA